MPLKMYSRAVAGVGAMALIGTVLMGQAAIASAAPQAKKTAPVFVSPHGSAGKSGTSCDSAKFASINAGVLAAPKGGTVVVCQGTYKEDVLVNKALTLTGQDATINAAGLENGIQVVASHVWVGGFTIRNANGEGILVGVDTMADGHLLESRVLKDETIQDNNAVNDNKGFSPTGQFNCKYPGDCGGGIHLNVVSHSAVLNNKVNGNSDGILLTDDYGPNSFNLVQGNIVNDNKSECGIVLPSHSSNAVNFDPNTFALGSRNPSQGGVFDNVVRLNVADRNGTNKAPQQFGGLGSGSGIGLFGSGPGSAVYNNLVEDNEASGNGLAGIAMHAHHPGGEDINGNHLIGNALGTNNVAGDGFDGPPTIDLQTTGIAIYSVPAVQMTIANNTIHQDFYGIWLSPTVHANGLASNSFSGVPHPVFVSPTN